MLAWTLLLACSEPPVEDTGGPSDSPVDDWTPPSPELTADQVAVALEATLAVGFVDPHELMDLYLELLTHGDGRCPDDPEQLTDTVVYGCEAASGYYYMGVAEYREERWGETQLRELGGDFLIRTPEGALFEMGAGTRVAQDFDQELSTLLFMGTLTNEWHEGWMRQVSAILEGTLSPIDQTGVLTLNGGLRFGDETLDLSALTFDPARCSDAPTGGLGYRGPQQRWYIAELDCGCGPLTFEGQELGEVCFDLSALAAASRETLRETRW